MLFHDSAEEIPLSQLARVRVGVWQREVEQGERVIVGVNRTAVRDAEQVEDLLNVRSGEVIRVYVERDGQITFTDLVFR